MLLENLMELLVLIGNPLINWLAMINVLYWSRKFFNLNCVVTDRWERSGINVENVGPTFSSMTVLLGGNSLKNTDYGLITS